MLEALAGVVAVVDPDLARPWLLRLLNISNYWMLPWVALGLAGQTLFFLRMAVQWIASERQRASVVPTIYWWFSLAGGLLLLSYFIWRKDAVGVLGQSTGAIVYARNLWLIKRS